MAKKVILSRKGFDSSTGGKPSPIIDNKLISISIPRADSGDFYKKMALPSGGNYLNLLKDLGVRLYSEAHIDPDIQRKVIANRPKNWRGVFGQSGASESRLINNDVGAGDIFLFFGWFKRVEYKNGKWQYIKEAKDIHAIYGYLEVDYKLDHLDEMKWESYHPHVRDREDYSIPNSIYVAKETSSYSVAKAGWGCFELDEPLILTKEDSNIRSLWELPHFLKNEKFSMKPINIKNLENGNIEFQLYGRGDQEVMISDNPEIVKWARDLIESSKVYE